MPVSAFLMGLAFVLIWSSAFTSARIIVADAAPLHALAVRYAISGGIAVGLAWWLGQSWHLTASQWRATIIFGICQNALYLGLNFVAMQSVEASVAVIVASMLPLTVALASALFLRERLTPIALLGLTLGAIGVTLIMGARISGGIDLFGLALCVAGLLALTAATLLVRGTASEGNVLMIVGLQMLAGGVPLAAAALLTEPFRLSPSWPLLAAFSYTVLFPGLIATIIWFRLLNLVGPTRAATFHFLNPFVGVAIAALLLDEALGFLDLIGVAIVTAGILAVQLGRQRPRSEDPE